MCLIVFAWRPGHAHPLIVAANRDEFYARPSLPLAQWPDAPHIYAGRDQEAGGTWLGVSAEGRFAALTNIRDPTSRRHVSRAGNWWRDSSPVRCQLTTTWPTLTAVRLNTP